MLAALAFPRGLPQLLLLVLTDGLLCVPGMWTAPSSAKSPSTTSRSSYCMTRRWVLFKTPMVSPWPQHRGPPWDAPVWYFP